METFINSYYIEKLEEKNDDDLIEDIIIDNNENIKIIFKCEGKYFEVLDFIYKKRCDIIVNELIHA